MKIYDKLLSMTECLQTFKNMLLKLSCDKNVKPLERQVAAFYLGVLKPYDDRVLRKQRGFGRGVGGSGDNIIMMPVVERDAQRLILDENGNLKIVRCVFDDFQSYLNHIECRLPVKRNISRWHSLPSCVNGLTADEYQDIWSRSQGISTFFERE